MLPGSQGRQAAHPKPLPLAVGNEALLLQGLLVLSAIFISPMKAGGELCPCAWASLAPTPPSWCLCGPENSPRFETPKSTSFWRTVWLMGTVWAPSFLAEAARTADMLCLFSSPQRERDRTSRAAATPGRSGFGMTSQSTAFNMGNNK